MAMPRGRVTNGLALVTAGLWLLAEIAGWQAQAIGIAGFVPLHLAAGGGPPGALQPWLTPLSATLVHGNFAHVAFNLIMLVYCGRFVENVIGPAPLAVLYVVGAYAAALAQYLIDPASPVPMIGASGAISALVAAYAMFFGQGRARAIGPIPARAVNIAWLAAGWIAVSLLFGFVAAANGTQIAVAAHIGGFIAGLLLARPLLIWRYRRA